MPEENLSTLSVSQLKEILVTNHVPARMVLEKSELVARVVELLTTERREREHMEAVREREAWEAHERAEVVRMRERITREREQRAQGQEQEPGSRRTTVEDASESDDSLHSQFLPPNGVETMEQADYRADSRLSTPPDEGRDSPMAVDVEPDLERDIPLPPRPERTGLCVVCQDEESNIVIIDCGYVLLWLFTMTTLSLLTIVPSVLDTLHCAVHAQISSGVQRRNVLCAVRV